MRIPFLTTYCTLVYLSCSVHAQVAVCKVLNAGDSTTMGYVAVYVDSTDLTYFSSGSDGMFYLHNLSEGTHSIRLQYENYRDTTFSITLDSSHYTFEFLYTIICDYDQSGVKHDCPVCHKQDEVIPVSYGYPSPSGLERSQQGAIYLGGCEVSDCAPRWHCRRCKREF